MGYKLEFNTILSVPEGQLDLANLAVGKTYEVTKSGERLFVLNIPIDLCGDDYQFIAKVVIRKLTLSRDKTELLVEVLKLFSPEESLVISKNFAKQA